MMGGKGGGGGGNYYQAPPDTSGYSTPEEATATLMAQKPLDMSKYQQAIDVQKAAAAATAPKVADTPPVQDTQLAEKMASTVLDVPKSLQEQRAAALLKPRNLGPHRASSTITQT